MTATLIARMVTAVFAKENPLPCTILLKPLADAV
jgi:hypothetical protein